MSLQKNCVRRGWFVGLAFGARALGAVVALGVLWPFRFGPVCDAVVYYADQNLKCQ